MSTSKNKPNRQSVHLSEYNYCQPGYYYLTICTKGRRHLFGTSTEGTMRLNNAGLIAQAERNKLPQRFLHVSLDAYIFMPNHMHGVLILTEAAKRVVKTPDFTRIPERFHNHLLDQAIQKQRQQKPLPLWEIIRTFKAATSHLIHKSGMKHFSWQAGTYTSVLASEDALALVRHYMIENPAHWEKDKLHWRER